MITANEARIRAIHGRTLTIQKELDTIFAEIKEATDRGEYLISRTIISDINMDRLRTMGFEVLERNAEIERYFTVISWEKILD